ncbi:MAG TPA: hypothetical protein PLM09_16990 [Casimicrobiaceae bacterium]|nr:hypothetical protein [Casimicrobiaceae bacterium]
MRNSIIVLAASMLTASCASMTTSYSEVTGDRFNLTVMDRRAVDIVSVGSASGWAGGAPVQVEPGKHRIVISSPRHGGFRGTTVDFELDIAPCTRYYVNAQFANPLSPQFVPVVDHEERISGCVWPRPPRA